MDATDQNTSLDDFLTWKVSALREYLTRRGMTKDGTKSELAALCYSSLVLKIPVVPSTFDIVKNNKLDYVKLLQIGSETLPDPLQIHDNWIDEKNGISRFPPVYISDIIKYFSEKVTSIKMKEILQDYKIGKAYEYFKNGFLQEIFYYDINSRSKYCFLRAKCVPSQKLKEDEHDVWVCVEKTTGEIRSSYCTCTAGLGGTCNHVGGLLFRVEATNKLGLTACTSLPCTWKIPSRIKGVKPTKLKNLQIIKSRHGQSESKRPLVCQMKSQYQPIPESRDTLDTFSAVLKKSIPNACFFKGFVTESEEAVTKPIVQDLKAYTIANIKEQCNNITEFLNNMPKYNINEIQEVEHSTIGQSDNNKWHEIRSGRLTSSNFYEIHTKVQSSKKKEGVSFDTLISRLMGYTRLNPNIKSLKHGREMEPEAKSRYQSDIKKAGHTAVTIKECGVFLDNDMTYLGASPDLLIDCACCGSGVVEIKCPLIPKCCKCTTFCSCSIPDYLFVDGTKYSLKKKHKYYGQIQGQLAITGRKFCDFFIYTCNGTFCQRIVYDKPYYEEIVNSLTFFFENHFVPELFSGRIKMQNASNQQDLSVRNNSSPNNDQMEFETTFFCPCCNHIVKNSENVQYLRDNSICCDICDLWYHFRCVNITKKAASKLQKWVCKNCTQI